MELSLDSKDHSDRMSYTLPPAGEAFPATGLNSRLRQGYWEVRELVTIGVLAATTKVTSLLVALVGGGMNPLSFVFKNLVFTSLLVVLLFKVRKSGSLALFVIINIIVTMLLMGGGFFLLPSMLLAGILAEGVILALGGYRQAFAIMVGVGVYDILFKAGSLAISWIMIREQPQLLWVSAVMVAIGYTGSLAGLVTGFLFVKELRHAGIIRE